MGERLVNMNAMLAPGMFVTHPDAPEWGVGQVQSNVEGRITVNFREAGKVVINGAQIMLILTYPDDPRNPE